MPDHASGRQVASRHEHGDSDADLRLMIRAASMYHLDGATQAEIARRLGVSRPTAGRLVARARSRGLVKIIVDVPAHLSDSIHDELETALESAYGLDEVVIVDEQLDDYRPAALAALGRAAGAVVARRLKADDTLGFTWGPETVAAADGIPGRVTGCRHVVQLDGALGGHDFRTGIHHIVGQLTDRLRAEFVPLVSPLFADAETVAAIRSDSRISSALAAGAKADVMMFGCGTLGPEATLMQGAFLDPVDVEELRRLGAVGEVGGAFYDAAGADVHPDLVSRTVSVPLDAVRDCPTSILISGGAPHRDAIRGALAAGLATVLVTDHATAQWLNAQWLSTHPSTQQTPTGRTSG